MGDRTGLEGVTGLDEDGFLKACAGLVDVLRERAGEGERLRQLPQATIDEVAEAGLFAVITPTSLGGHGLGLDTLAQGARTMAHGCPAAAWTLSFLMLHSWLLSRFPAEGRAEMFADGAIPLAPAPLAPTGMARAVDGGFRLDGRWEWATGVAHGDWVLVHAVEAPSETGGGIADLQTRFLALPRHDVEVDDVWFTSGMRATGSNTVRVEDRFVPTYRTLPAQEMMFSTGARTGESVDRVEGDGMAGLPVAAVLALVASAPALGAAEAVVGLYRRRLTDRVLAYTLGERAKEQPAAQVRLATAMSEVRAARHHWDRTIADLLAANAAGTVDEDQRVAARLAAAATVRAARHIVSTVADGAGASVYLLESPLQRLQRDVEVLKGHVIFDWDRATELAGRHALGFPLRLTDLV